MSHDIAATLAQLVIEIAGARVAAERRVFTELGRERDELQEALSHADEPDVLARGRAGLETELDRLVGSRTAAEKEVAQLEGNLSSLQEQLNATILHLEAQCLKQAQALPTRGEEGALAWAQWLRGWYASRGIPWNRAQNREEALRQNSAVQDTLRGLVEPLVSIQQQLDKATGGERELERVLSSQDARIRELRDESEAIAHDLLRSAGPLRVVNDIPDPSAAQTSRQLHQIHEVLRFYESILGRYAASAVLEAQMLSTLT